MTEIVDAVVKTIRKNCSHMVGNTDYEIAPYNMGGAPFLLIKKSGEVKTWLHISDLYLPTICRWVQENITI